MPCCFSPETMDNWAGLQQAQPVNAARSEKGTVVGLQQTAKAAVQKDREELLHLLLPCRRVWLRLCCASVARDFEVPALDKAAGAQDTSPGPGMAPGP